MHNARMCLTGARPGRRRQAQRGQSLVEVLVGSALALLALAAFASFNRAQIFAISNQAEQIDLQSVGRNFTDLFVRELRRAGMDPTCAKNFEGIAEARPDRIEIKADLDGNGVIDAAGEDVLYAYNSIDKTVERTTGGLTDVLLEGVNVGGSTLKYYDGAGVEVVPSGNPPALTVAQRASVRRVQIALSLQEVNADPLNSLPNKAKISSNVDLRNRFFLASTACL